MGNSWIDVRDRLPYDASDSQVSCLMWDDCGEDIGVIHIGFYDTDTGSFHVYDESFDDSALTVTHWMPLPRPPISELEPDGRQDRRGD